MINKSVSNSQTADNQNNVGVTPPPQVQTFTTKTQEIPVLTTSKESPGMVVGNVTQNSSTAKVVATIFSLVVLVGVAISMEYIQKRQAKNVAAWDCSNYSFAVSRDGIVSVHNLSMSPKLAQRLVVSIDGEQKGIFDIPKMDPGKSVTTGSVQVPDNQIFSWQAEGLIGCSNSGEYK